jgi:hypothetical protein
MVAFTTFTTINGTAKEGIASKWPGLFDFSVVNPNKASLTRCNPEQDSGLTRAEEVSRDPFFCVFFARGCCGKGYNCNYLHRIPTEYDELKIEKTRDCFGRERHRSDKDDMSGTGSFERDNRTLNVARIGSYQEGLEDVLRSHFGKFGEIVAVKILHTKVQLYVG